MPRMHADTGLLPRRGGKVEEVLDGKERGGSHRPTAWAPSESHVVTKELGRIAQGPPRVRATPLTSSRTLGDVRFARRQWPQPAPDRRADLRANLPAYRPRPRLT